MRSRLVFLICACSLRLKTFATNIRAIPICTYHVGIVCASLYVRPYFVFYLFSVLVLRITNGNIRGGKFGTDSKVIDNRLKKYQVTFISKIS